MDTGLLMDVAVHAGRDPLRDRLSRWSRAQGNRTLWSLTLLGASGLVLWDPLHLPWLVERQLLMLHVAASMVLFPLFVLPFWRVHRELLRFSHNGVQRTTGRIIDALLALVLISGLVLVFSGNPGNSIGQIAFWCHLLVAIPLLVSLALHVTRRLAATRAIAILWAQIRSPRP